MKTQPQTQTSSAVTGLTALQSQPHQTALTQVPTNTIALKSEQVAEAERRLEAMDFATMTPGEITRIGLEETRCLQQTLDAFLSSISDEDANILYQLCQRLNQGVDDAQLLQLYEQTLREPRFNILQHVLNFFRGISSETLARQTHEEAARQTRERTSQLMGLMTNLEGELQQRAHNLTIGLGAMEDLKRSYTAHIDNLAVAAKVAQGLVEKAERLVVAKQAELETNPNLVGQTELQQSQANLDLLRSRALSLEGAYTRLPADHQVIQQIQGAGVGTLQEVVITSTDRFNSIKMTLLSLHGLQQVKGLQMIAENQRDLDNKLSSLRHGVMKDVVTSAANAPGENRLAQAQQIMKIVEDNRVIHRLVEEGRATNQQRFSEAGALLASARQELAMLSQDSHQTQGE